MAFQPDFQTTNFCMYEEMEYEDDAFYRELRKQVLQLTEEEEEDDDQEPVCGNRNLNMVADKKQDIVAPAWITNSWKTGNGTGVFIPQILQNKKKNRPRRKRNQRGTAYGP